MSNKITRNLKYHFSEAEITEKGRNISKLTTESNQATEQKKASASEFQSKIDFLKERMNSEALKINMGFEYRNVECEVLFNHPQEGKKQVTRTDTGEVFTEDMTNEDLVLFPELVS